MPQVTFEKCRSARASRASGRVTRMMGLGLALALLAPPVRAEDKPMPRTITVSGTAQVTAEPDLARITSGVTIEADTARDALARNSEAMRKVIAALKGKGIDPKDIQTSAFRIEPKYTPAKDRAPSIAGYRAVNQVHVTVRDLARLGDILDELVAAGANQMGGLSFDVTKADALKDSARKEAVANALRRAKLLATAAGAEVGEVVTISEEVESMPVPGRVMARAAPMGAAPIETGSEILEARVTITWALK